MNREKKQLVVVGVLVTLILAVGGFQFMRGSDAPPPVAAKKDDQKTAEAKKAEAPVKANPQLTDMPPKDPFTPAGFIGGEPPAPNTPVTTTVKTPTNKDILRNHQTSQEKLGGGLGAWPPGGKEDFGFGKGKDEVKPAEPEKPVFGYNLVGIVEGAHPMAVFEDGSGNQQLVEVGQGIGPSSTVTHISRGTVRVKFNAETLTFNVGGNPHAK